MMRKEPGLRWDYPQQLAGQARKLLLVTPPPADKMLGQRAV